jgi:hypothetical protein
LAGDEVGVLVALEMRDTHLLGSSHVVEECFVLGDVVGVGCEVDSQCVAELVALR